MKINRKHLVGLVAGALCATAAHAADYSAWTGSRSIVLNTSATGANITNPVYKFPMLIRLSQNEAATMAAAKAGGADIRFSKADGTTPLPFEIESWEPNGAAIWVLMDTVKANSTTQTIKMYWGNPAATSISNGPAVFDTANGYVGAWHFGNGSGDVRPGSVVGSPAAYINNGAGGTSVKGIIGRADTLRHFPSVGAESSDPLAGSWIDLTHNNNGTPLASEYSGYSDFTNGISYSLWVRPDGPTAFWRMLVMAPSDAVTAGDRILFMAGAGNDTAVAVRWTSGCGYVAGANPCNVENGVKLNQWNHVFITKTPGNSAVQFYINGALVGSSSSVANASNVARAIAWIGRAGDNNPYFSGLIDDATLAKASRSADFIKLSYENQKAVNTLVDVGLGGPVTSTPYGAWSGHRTITLNTTATGANVKGNVANFPVLIRLTSAEASIRNAAKANGADIRFSKTDDATPIPYAIESWDSTGAAIWVKIDTVKGNSTQAIRMHWGNPAASDSSRSAVVFDTANGYRGVFHMNQATGDVIDATINAVVGTNTGTTSVKGLAGPARNFGGTNAANTSSTTDRQYIEVGTPGVLSFAGKLSMSAWVRWTYFDGTENETYYRTIINRDGTSPSAETFLRLGQNSGSIDYGQYTTGKYTGSADILAQSPQLASAYPDSAVWTHLAGVYDSTSPTSRLWKLYRNGVLIGTSTDDAQAAVTGAATRWRFGRGPGTQNARWFAGDMDEIRIDAVTRDSNYVKLSYENQKPANSLVDIGTYVTPVVPFAPTAVTAVKGTAAGSITVSWTASSFNGNAAITSYTATATPGGATCVATPPSVSCTVSGLTSGTSYTFTVVATNSVGNSPASAPSSGVTSLLPGGFAIHMDGSNPYSYRIPASALATTEQLKMTVVDLHGKRLWSRTVYPMASKVGQITWDGRTTAGEKVSAGMYIVRIQMKTGEATTGFDTKGVLKP